MKCNPNFIWNRWLSAGITLNAVRLCAIHLLEVQDPLALGLVNFLGGLAVALLGLGLLHATPKGRALVDRVCRWKHDTFGKGAA